VRLHRAIYEVTHDADRTEHSAAAIAACTSGPPETTYHRGLARTIAPYRETVNAVLVHLDVTRPFEKVIDAIRATPAETQEDLADLEEDTAMTRRALDLLGAGKADAYDAALAALREDTRHWWEEVLARGPGELEEVQEPYTADAAGLLPDNSRMPRPAKTQGSSRDATIDIREN
jgi:hypothetical protein